MSARRPLPNHCLWGIDEAETQASSSLREALSLLDERDKTEVYRKLGKIIDSQHRILSVLAELRKPPMRTAAAK